MQGDNNMSNILEHPSGGAAKSGMSTEHCENLMLTYLMHMHAVFVYDCKLVGIDLEGDGFPLLE